MSLNSGRTFIYLLISQVFLCFQWAISQNFYTPVSLDLQVGQSIVNQYLEAEQQDYSALTFQFKLTHFLLKSGDHGSLLAYEEVHAGLGRLLPERKNITEAAFNLGCLFRWRINKKEWYAFVSSSTGPAFIDTRLSRQAEGFLFSNNFSGGVSYTPRNKRIRLTFQGRFRHMSNANIKKPNGGINNYIFLAGLAYLFRNTQVY